MLKPGEFGIGQEAAILRVDQVIQDLALRASCNSGELSEFLVLESKISFCNVSWTRSRGVAKLIAILEIADYFGALQERVDAQL